MPYFLCTSKCSSLIWIPGFRRCASNNFLFVLQFIDLSSAVSLGSLESESKPTVTKTVSLGNAVFSVSGKNNEVTSSSATPTFMVLTTSSNLSTPQNTTSNGTVNLVAASPATTMTVRAANAAGALTGTKTIVVMPVSSTVGSGDGQTAIKRLKTD